MKANEAPEKIYLLLTTGSHILNGKYYEYKPAKIRYDDIIIEYTRTDAFIEKAADWLNNFYNEDTHSYLIDEDIEKFINYMKGE